MARSSRRFGAKIPGVSMKTSCEPSAIAMPRSSARVVCTLWDTIATLLPTSALISVDLPTLGAPTSAMNPQRVCVSDVATGGEEAGADGVLSAGFSVARSAAGRLRRLRSTIDAARIDTGARQHGGGGGLLGRALRAAHSLRGRKVGKLDGHAELRIVVGALALDLPVGRGRKSARLRPFLQHRLRIA